MSEVDFNDYLNDQLADVPADTDPAPDPVADATPVEAVSAETPDEPAADERARDEAGRFTKAATDDDIEAKLAALEKRLADKDEFIGRLSNEVGELRQAKDQPAQPQATYNISDLIETDPAAAAELAYQQGDQFAFTQAWQSWNEVAPGAPQAWYRAVQAEQRVGALEQQIQQIDRGQQPLVQQNNSHQALNELAAQYPDIGAVLASVDEGRMSELISSPLFPSDYLGRSDVEAQKKVLGATYLLAREHHQHAVTTAQAQADAETAQQAVTDKAQAAVASASSAPAAEGTGDTELDAFYAFMLQPTFPAR